MSAMAGDLRYNGKRLCKTAAILTIFLIRSIRKQDARIVV